MVTSAPQRFRERPIEVQAMRWDSTNTDEVKRFVGLRQQAGAPNAAADGSGVDGFLLVHGPQGTAVVFDRFRGSVLMGVGDWVVRGTQGEFFPCSDEVFAARYAPAAPDER